MSQSSEQGAPERIWLIRVHPDLPEIRSVKGAPMYPACASRTSVRDIEYTRSDICAALVEAAEHALLMLLQSNKQDDYTERTINELNTALAQVKTDDK